MDPVTGARARIGWDFTCLVPVHGGDNADHFVAAMESIAASSVAPAEILICQDGDLPESLEDAVHTYARRRGARRVSNPGPKGLHHNLNRAMGDVRTPYVARADADDINLPGRFEAQVGFVREHPNVAALGGAIIEVRPDGRGRRKAMPLTHDDILRYARWRNPINHMTAFFRTEAFLDCGGYPDIPMKEDYALWLTMIGRGLRLANLGDDLVRARLGETFYERRSGLRNFSSEYALYRLKRQIPRMGVAAAIALLARPGALAFAGSTRLIYERILRR